MPAKATIDLSPSVSIPTLEFASQGNAVLGIRGSGKTYSATWLAEQLHEQEIPFVAFEMDRLIEQSGYTAATVRKYLPILRRNKLIHANELRVNPDLV